LFFEGLVEEKVMNRLGHALAVPMIAAITLCVSSAFAEDTASDAVSAGTEQPVSPESPHPSAKDAPSSSGLPDALRDTRWRLVAFQSMDDAIGVTHPDDPSLYTMHLGRDGTVTMRLNCNRATGTWSATPTGNGTSGHFEFGPLATTLAICPPPSMDESIAAQAQHIRSYVLEKGRLYLSLMADGGIYVWEPDTESAHEAEVPPAPEDGGPRH